jgi:cobalt/nickel transport system ATP-binding protein
MAGRVIPLLEADALFYRYAGYAGYVLNGTTLRLLPGQRVALMGRNGSGKSTLLLHCNGILRPERGQVCVGGIPMRYDRNGLKQWRQLVGMVFQHPDDQLFSASVMQDISFGPLNLGLHKDDVWRRVQMAANMCGVSDLLDRPTHALSGGEKARVALAGVLAMEPQVLLADEVIASLDPWMRRQVLDIFDHLVGLGKAVLLSTHDVHLAKAWADEVLVMEEGCIAANETTMSVLAELESLVKKR